ncbi:conserved hypothetical protein [Trichinella spiralis]|uniref:hypothetical protein n=1 Tax=Trichinella spiralis TaxID=6334 RepID=UPI0001EFD9D2|nr:conserved hypothetical protein [Trichinella spiralis]
MKRHEKSSISVCSPACLLASCLHTYLTTCQPASLPACLPVWTVADYYQYSVKTDNSTQHMVTVLRMLFSVRILDERFFVRFLLQRYYDVMECTTSADTFLNMCVCMYSSAGFKHHY